jgi:hypothetical protein
MPLPLDQLEKQPTLVNRRAQELDWDELLFEYELALDDIQAWLRGLSEEQIHFKPAPEVFSIAEIVTHNSFSDNVFWSWAALLARGRAAEIDPQRLVSADAARNTATLLDLAGANEACRTLARNTIEALPAPPDLAATTPHPYFGQLNAKSWIYFMALQRGRQRIQCESVIDAPGFPRSASMQTQPREAYQPSERKTWLKKDTRSKKRDAGSKSQGVKPSTAGKRTSKKKTAPRSK